MGSTFYIPAQNLMGSGAVAEAINTMRAYGFKRVLIVTDAYMSQCGMADNIQTLLQANEIASRVFDGVQPRRCSLYVLGLIYTCSKFAGLRCPLWIPTVFLNCFAH